MFTPPRIASFVFACTGFVTLSLGCGGAVPNAGAPSSAQASAPNGGAPPADRNNNPPCAGVSGAGSPAASFPAAPAQEMQSAGTESAKAVPGDQGVQFTPAEAGIAEADQVALAARATGPANGGPRGTRPCAFHESVDTYQRQCTAKVLADGSVLVSAKGTALNPDHGFELTLHGGDNQWVAKGTLNAFGQCTGPFVAPVTTSLDHGIKIYELRFKQHCMIVVR